MTGSIFSHASAGVSSNLVVNQFYVGFVIPVETNSCTFWVPVSDGTNLQSAIQAAHQEHGIGNSGWNGAQRASDGSLLGMFDQVLPNDVLYLY